MIGHRVIEEMGVCKYHLLRAPISWILESQGRNLQDLTSLLPGNAPQLIVFAHQVQYFIHGIPFAKLPGLVFPLIGWAKIAVHELVLMLGKEVPN